MFALVYAHTFPGIMSVAEAVEAEPFLFHELCSFFNCHRLEFVAEKEWMRRLLAQGAVTS